jgi:hypothetical protein
MSKAGSSKGAYTHHIQSKLDEDTLTYLKREARARKWPISRLVRRIIEEKAKAAATAGLQQGTEHDYSSQSDNNAKSLLMR